MAFSTFSGSFNNLRRFPVGRYTFSMREVLKTAETVAAERGDASIDEIIALTRDHLEFGNQAHKLRMQYASAQAGVVEYRSQAPAIDSLSDRTISAMFKQVEGYEKNFGPNHRKGKAAITFNRRGFPGGPRDVTGLPYVEQVERMEAIIKLCDGELAEEVRILGLEDWVELLRAHTHDYRAELARTGSNTVTYPEVRAAEDECQERLAQLIALIGGTFNQRSDEHATIRRTLLAAIHEQDVAIARANRRTRRSTDIHPLTGLEEDNPISTLQEGENSSTEPEFAPTSH